MIDSIKPAQLRDELAGDGQAPLMLDVREPEEYALCRIEGSTHLPMGEVMQQLGTLDPDKRIVVICHHGMRSLQIARMLADSGFKHVRNLSGGIDAWASEVDPSLPRY